MRAAAAAWRAPQAAALPLRCIAFHPNPRPPPPRYDVKWEASEIKWASRWDTYLLMGDEQVCGAPARGGGGPHGASRKATRPYGPGAAHTPPPRTRTHTAASRCRQIHWFSIINSLMIVLFLTGMVAMIMMRTLHRGGICPCLLRKRALRS